MEHVEEQVDLQKPNLKIRVEHIEEQIDLQKLNLKIKIKECSKTYIIGQMFTTKDSKST
jgi:hypothetical protein